MSEPPGLRWSDDEARRIVRCVGPDGKAIGLDVTPAMLEKARENAGAMRKPA